MTEDPTPTPVRTLTGLASLFVLEYCVDFCGSKAARRAGYSPKSSAQRATELLKRPEIREAIHRETTRRLEAVGLKSSHIIEALRRYVHADVRKLWNAQTGKLKQIYELEPEEASLIAGFDVSLGNLNSADGQKDTLARVRLNSRMDALALAAKVLGMVTDTSVSVSLEGVGARLESARKRIAGTATVLPGSSPAAPAGERAN